MMRRNWFLTMAACTLLLGCSHACWSRTVSGTSSLKLSKPATKEVVDQIRASAFLTFRIDLWEWMKEEAEVTVDTSNAIQRFHFFAFADSCVAKATSVPSRSGYDMSMTISIPGEDARSVLEAYNTRCYGVSLRYYTLMKKMLEDNAVTELYNTGIQTIFYTMGRMGTPIDMPDESTPRSFLLEDSRKIMQNFFNKFVVRAQDVIISGKPGTALSSPLTVQVLIDTLPLKNVMLIGALGNGRKICGDKSGGDGTVSFANFKIPYVAKGTMLYFRPDVASVVSDAAPFSARDLGLTLPEQSLLFNVVSPTYSLSYKANAANAIVIPKDFASDVYVKKFLKDSCYLTPVPPGQQPDLYISIASQVLSYSHDETEQTVRKLENDIVIQDASRKVLVQKLGMVFEKPYENSVPVPEGLFFWEAAGKSLQMIKSTISGL
jgi:hypothetical protein